MRDLAYAQFAGDVHLEESVLGREMPFHGKSLFESHHAANRRRSNGRGPSTGFKRSASLRYSWIVQMGLIGGSSRPVLLSLWR